MVNVPTNGRMDVKKLIVHCSDSDQEAHDHINIIRAWHVDGNRWKDVGYHVFIQNDGNIQFGRRLDEVGAHTKGENDDSIGICLAGRHYFSEYQYNTLTRVCIGLCLIFDLPFSEVYRHADFDDSKTCPNIDWTKFTSKMSWSARYSWIV
jgi:N-acetylmuramoyl-L-alanine amidase